MKVKEEDRSNVDKISGAPSQDCQRSRLSPLSQPVLDGMMTEKVPVSLSSCSIVTRMEWDEEKEGSIPAKCCLLHFRSCSISSRRRWRGIYIHQYYLHIIRT